MFKKKFIFKIIDSEALNFCKILGRYGVKFEIGKLHTVANADDPFRALQYPPCIFRTTYNMLSAFVLLLLFIQEILSKFPHPHLMAILASKAL